MEKTNRKPPKEFLELVDAVASSKKTRQDAKRYEKSEEENVRKEQRSPSK